jgi:hypothetical protein
MFWKYTYFEWKRLLKSRKSWFIGAFLLFFFLLYFFYYSQDEPPTLHAQKKMETEMSYAIFYYLDIYRHDIPEVEEVYNRHVEIQSLLGMQVWHIGDGNDPEQYIEDGLEINRLRLEIHDLENAGIPDHLITPREEILQEEALLHYITENNLPIESESFATNHYVTNALGMMSGLLFLVLLLISGNDILLYERQHSSVMKGMPLPFMRKVTSKVLVHAMFLLAVLLVGFVIGSLYLSANTDGGGFSFPMLMYQNESYEAISTLQYCIYLFFGFFVVIIVVLLLSVLLNMLFHHAFLNVLIALGIFFLPDLIAASGFQPSFLHPIKFIDIHRALTGELAVQLNQPAIEYGSVLLTLVGFTIILILIIFILNRYTYQRKPAHSPIEKAF